MIKKIIKTTLFFFLAAIILIGLVLYRIHTQTTIKKLPGKAPEIQLTILEGWTANEIGAYLEKQGVSQEKNFISAEKNFDLSAYPLLSSKPQNSDLEGFLFPDTYRIFKPTAEANYLVKNSDPNAQLIGKMLANFSAKFTPEMQAQADKQKMTVYQIITLASIVEKESARNPDTQKQDDLRKIVAGIFYNRLKINMALESDATVNYVTGKNDTQPLIADTQIDSPYNTYKNTGLPPGPICNPSLSSIMAALYPAQTDYLYFLNDSSGNTYYAKTYQDHLLNKQKYLNNKK